MEASAGLSRSPAPPNPAQPDVEKIKRRLLKYGVLATPKIIRALRKKELLKLRRKSKRMAARTQGEPSLSDSQKKALAEESHFQTISREYRDFIKAAEESAEAGSEALTLQRPLRGVEGMVLTDAERAGDKCPGEELRINPSTVLGHFLVGGMDKLRWLLDDDIEVEQNWLEDGSRRSQRPLKRRRSVAVAIELLLKRLSASNPHMKDHKFSKMMKQSGLRFTPSQLLKIVEALGASGQWKHALSIVEWVYRSNDHQHDDLRVVFTKLLTILRKARRPDEAFIIFNLMLNDCQIYPDMPAYHNIAITLGQAGLLRELVNIVDCMKQKPSNKIKNMSSRSWDTILQPDVVVFNAVLKACVPLRKWKGVFWVFEQLRKGHLEPDGTTYQLAMELLLHSGKYDLVHLFFEKMKRSGEALNAAAYEVLVRAYWKQGKLLEAIGVVRDMEQRRLVRAASVYSALVCCLCYHGKWQDSMVYVDSLIKLPDDKHLKITFTGMIRSAMDGGHAEDCISIFECMKDCCDPNIGTINAMLKVYGQLNMFSKAKQLFEETRGRPKAADGDDHDPDECTYVSMLELCARDVQWEYFDYVYREMALSGYQLDQSKHTSLVEASRAGKVHVLDHAFDSTLKAGELPDPSIFMEMVSEGMVFSLTGRGSAGYRNWQVRCPLQKQPLRISWGLFGFSSNPREYVQNSLFAGVSLLVCNFAFFHSRS